MEPKRLSPDEVERILTRHVDTLDEEQMLRGHIAALEAEIATQGQKLPEIEAIHMADLDAWESERQRWAKDANAELATQLATAQMEWSKTADKLSRACEERDTAIADRDGHHQTAEVWRRRVHEAAEALADVLPGEVGRMDLKTRIGELKRQRDEAGDSLKPTGQVAEWLARFRNYCEFGEDLEAYNGLAAKAQGYENAKALLAEFASLPYVIDEATIPEAGPDSAPNQVVGTLHVSLGRMRRLRELLARVLA